MSDRVFDRIPLFGSLRRIRGWARRKRGWLYLVIAIGVLFVVRPFLLIVAEFVKILAPMIGVLVNNPVGRFVFYNVLAILLLWWVWRRVRGGVLRLIGLRCMRHFLDGMQAMMLSRWRPAMRHFEQVVRWTRWVRLEDAVPEHRDIAADAKIKIATCHHRLGESNEALAWLKRVSEKEILTEHVRRNHAELHALAYDLNDELEEETVLKELEATQRRDRGNRRVLRALRDRLDGAGELDAARTVGNLIGEINVEPANGSRFEVVVEVQGRDAKADSIRFERREGARAMLDVVFPVQKERRYVYPELGRGTTNFRLREDRDRGWLRELIAAVASPEIKVTGSGSGHELWADVTIRVPAGSRLVVKHGVGKVFARNVDADLSLDVTAGQVDGEALRGEVRISTGSGSVTLDGVDGELLVDTGSGAVKVANVRGPSVSIDTGSGRVVLEDIETKDLLVDTGSGSVNAERVRAGSATVDTGSGSVVLALLEMGSGRFDIDTGSGSITLLLPALASADVQADTGSGGIKVDLPSVQTLHRERDEMRFRVGSGAAQVRLDTGSGAIRVGPVD
jgi:hypothetical protein